MKKTLSILLAILLVLSTVPFASALVFTDGVINAGKDYKVTCGAKEELTYVTFTPETSGLYVFSSSDYDENGSAESPLTKVIPMAMAGLTVATRNLLPIPYPIQTSIPNLIPSSVFMMQT